MTTGECNWYYQVGDQVHGPMSFLDVREKAAAGEIEPGTLIRSGNEEWRRADHVYFLSEFFPPVERSEDWWQEISRSVSKEEIQQCKGHLILLVVSCLLPLGVVLVGSLLYAAGVDADKAGVIARMVEKALPIALLLLGGAIFKSIFGLWINGWEATREAARMIWAELRHRPSNQHGSEK
jgi:GYF domain 2